MKSIKYSLTAFVGLALSGCAASHVDDRALAPPVEKVAVRLNAFEVFFDPDRTDISEAAAKILRNVAVREKEINASGIKLSIHSTAAGWSAFSQDLSERRADVVKVELVKDGVPAAKISYVDVPRTLLASTVDGVREPQNRRTEITLY